MEANLLEICTMIDHSILHPTSTDADLERECAVALKYKVASVCVKPYAVKHAASILKGSGISTCCVIGFPHGNSSTKIKTLEAQLACTNGAKEIDMVINIGKALGGQWDYVESEIKEITKACHELGAIIKVIFETDYITSVNDIVRLCHICTSCESNFVKTSTSFGFVKNTQGNFYSIGATVQNVSLMRNNSGPGVQVKASGGIRTLPDLLKLKAAGASRIGTSSTIEILSQIIM